MQTVKLGSLGEAKAITEFLKLNFTIYTPFSEGNDPFDFIAVKDGKLLRVEVKSTDSTDINGNFVVTIRSIRNNNTSSRVKLFDQNNCDLVACYIKPLDSVCFIPSKDVKSKRSLTFREEYSTHKTMPKSRQRLVRDYSNLKHVLCGLDFLFTLDDCP
jgi:hypothetical protein